MERKEDIILCNVNWSKDGPYRFCDLSDGEVGVLFKMIVLYQAGDCKKKTELAEAYKLNSEDNQYITNRVLEMFEYIKNDMDSEEFKQERNRQLRLPKEAWE